MRAGVLLDRDGTIIEDYHYVGHIERVQFIPGAIEAIRRFNSNRIPVVIVTNQGGVARGFYEEADVYKVNDYINAELARHDAHVDGFYYSPHHPDGTVKPYARESYDHKPNPGMALRAAEDHDLDLTSSIVVGDRITDIELAQSIGAHAIYIGKLDIPCNKWQTTFHSLAEAASYIIERLTRMSDSTFPTMNYVSSIGYFTHYADELCNVIRNVSQHGLSKAADILYKAATDGSMVYTAGNGGASAIAEHFVTDYIKQLGTVNTFYTNAASLCSNMALISATANDMGYDAIFSYQLERSAQPDDVLIVFSVGGNSANIIRALQFAQENNMRSIAVLGGDGGQAIYRAEAKIHIPTWNYGIAEDIMSMIHHSLCQYVRQTQMTDQQIASARF